MGHGGGPGRWLGLAILTASLAVGFGVLLLLLPAGGVDADPPRCFSTFGYTVPCGAGLSFACGAVVAGVVGLGLSRRTGTRR